MTELLELTTLVDEHLAAYGDADTVRRAEVIARIWAADGELVDPPIDGAGHDGIAAMTDAVLGLYPDHTFRRVTAVDAHHRFARYGWELVDAAGSVVLTGTDVAEIGEDGRLAMIVGFFGDLR